jgi:hypothetical protein
MQKREVGWDLHCNSTGGDVPMMYDSLLVRTRLTDVPVALLLLLRPR